MCSPLLLLLLLLHAFLQKHDLLSCKSMTCNRSCCVLFFTVHAVHYVLCSGNLEFVMQAQAGGINCARVQVRAKKLLQLCLSAFIANRKSLELQQQVNRSSTAVPWPKLLDLVIKLTGEFPMHLMPNVTRFSK